MRYPVGNPSITELDIFAVTQAMRDKHLTQGAIVQQFEQRLGEYIGAPHVVVCSSGTSALHLALAILNLQPGDEVLVPNLTYVASANAVKYVGAIPVFVDIDPRTWNISLSDAITKITKRTKAILPVHLYGFPCDMTDIMEFADDYNLQVIEDAAEALSASWAGKHCGTYGICGTFSFYANKLITCGEGGAVVTNDGHTADVLRFLRGQAQTTQRFFHSEVGYNYRLTDMQAALGVSQLQHIEYFIQERLRVCQLYRSLLGDQLISPVCETQAPWMYTGLLPVSLKFSTVEKHMAANGIEVRPVFVPMNQLPMYEQPNALFPVSTLIGQQGISLPTYPDLTNSDVRFIVNTLLDCYV